MVSIIERRGIVFNDFMASQYKDGKLPVYRIIFDGNSEYFHKVDEFDNRLSQLSTLAEQNNSIIVDDIEQLEDEAENHNLKSEELTEVTRLNDVNKMLQEKWNLSLTDLLLKEERTVSGELKPMKFRIIRGEEQCPAASLIEVSAEVRNLGSKGIEIKRFKGLGEMNADQLWDTTMDPSRRVLLNVTIDDAGEADRLFSILMGDDVEKRRNFISEHALEVQNFDV